MNLALVDRVAKSLCSEISKFDRDIGAWRLLTEEHLLREACFCIFSSQMKFEVAEAITSRLETRGLLYAACNGTRNEGYQESVSASLSEAVTVTRASRQWQQRPRFGNRFASFLLSTIATMKDHGITLHQILRDADTAYEARADLIKWVKGFGPKQASLFLRRVGYSFNLAVLDTHIMDYLRTARGIDFKPYAIARLSSYELVEKDFRRIAERFGHSVGCVDLAIWVTVRVAKQEKAW